MRRTRQTRVTVETHRLVTLRQRQSGSPAWCQECATQVQMLEPEQAAAVAGVSCRTIYRWVEAERVHFVEDAGGRILICLNSLFDKSKGKLKT
ncbi:MAG: hypothetical protein HY650_13060 [Acidobacteria bacterium]|nr:hypothetical protein [Acidobacteriota bacterium]